MVINTFDLHVLSKKPVHEGQKSSSPHNFTIAASSLLMIQHFFHYVKNVKQLKWNFDKMSIYDSEKNTYEIYLFFKSNQNIKITKQSHICTYVCVCFEWLTFNTEIYLLELSNYLLYL